MHAEPIGPVNIETLARGSVCCPMIPLDIEDLVKSYLACQHCRPSLPTNMAMPSLALPEATHYFFC